MPKLFPEETIISTLKEETVTLTSHRICYENIRLGSSYNQSIMLEHITSCENYSVNKYWLLIMAGVVTIYGIMKQNDGTENALKYSLIIALILLVAFWITRHSLIVIGSPSTRMYVNVTGLNREDVLDFIDDIEQTKNKRLVSLNVKS